MKNTENRRFGRKLTAGLLALTIAFSTAAGFGADYHTVTAEAATTTEKAQKIIDGMTTEEKVAQLFFITPEALTGYKKVYQTGDVTKKAYSANPVGGIIYFSQNLISLKQTKAMISGLQDYSEQTTGLPLFFGVDEEGGLVKRIAGNKAFSVKDIGDASAIGAAGSTKACQQDYAYVGKYLADLGFNVDFAPDADVKTSVSTADIKRRSFSSNAATAAAFVAAAVKGLQSTGVSACAKHFPGLGYSKTDTHTGKSVISRTRKQLLAKEMKTFQSAISAGCDFIMVGHISDTALTGDQTPASLSSVVITDLLRKKLGYQGIVITDSQSMGAIVDRYGAGKAAVMSIQAGADMVLMPKSYSTAYKAVLAAVKSGKISEERLNEALLHIVKVKLA